MKKWKSWDCHDCGVKEGELHKLGCDMETCPFCGQQLISCDCCYKKLDIDVSEGTWAYSHGLTKIQEALWLEILDYKGRIPYLLIPYKCGLCGEQWSKMFTVSDKDWSKYVIPQLQHELLCYECYNELKHLFPNGWRYAK